MPRNQPNTNLMTLALEGRATKQTTPQAAAELHSPPAEATNAEPSPPPQARPEARRKRRDRSSHREGREKRKDRRGNEPEGPTPAIWQPVFRYRGMPITEDMSLSDSSRLAAELGSALLLPKDVEEANKLDKKTLTRSAIQMHAQSFQRSYIALSNLEEEVQKAEAVQLQNEELLLELNKLKVAQIEAEDAKNAAELAKREAEDEALAAKSHASEVEKLLAEKERENEEMKLQQQDKEDQAYNDGLDTASKAYEVQVLEIRKVLFEKGWTSALKKAGIPEDSSLFVVEDPFSEPAASPPSPLAPPSEGQDPPTPLE